MSSAYYRIRFGSLLIAAVALLIIILAFESNEASGKTITVDDDGGGDHETIQEAIDAAENGDTVRVWEGTYSSNQDIIVNKSIGIIGNGSENTGITLNDYSSIKIEADFVNFSGFKIVANYMNEPYEPYYTDEKALLIFSDHNNIFDNEFYYHVWGIYLISSNSTIMNNTFVNNYYADIEIEHSNNCLIMNNSFSNWSNGITIISSENCTLTYNILGVNCNIDLVNSNNCILDNNTLNGYGIAISGSLENWNSHIIEHSNSFRGKPIYHYKNMADITLPSEAGLVILANCTRGIVEKQNYGIWVGYCSYITFENNEAWLSLHKSSYCKIMNNNNSITVDESNNCEIVNNSYKITLKDSNNCTISNNTCSNIGSRKWYNAGIIIDSSNDCIIEYNTCIENDRNGIFLINSDRCTIKNNNCSSNNGNGISLNYSKECTISNNICSLNDDNGLLLQVMDNCSVEYNTCSMNDDFGINLESSDFCTIERNTIIGNRVGIKVGIHLAGPSLDNTVRFNEIFANIEYGIDVTKNEGYSLDATHNWWGDVSGPSHYSNIEGTGDNVTDYVLFDPWLEEEAPANFLPVISIALPMDGREVSGVVMIIGSASDLEGNETIIRVEISIDNREWVIVNGTTSWTFEWDTNSVHDGERTIRVRGFDGTDYSEVATIRVTVDNEDESDITFYLIIVFSLLIVVVLMVFTLSRIYGSSDNIEGKGLSGSKKRSDTESMDGGKKVENDTFKPPPEK